MNMQRLMESWRLYENEEQLIEAKSIMKEKYPFKAIFVVGPAGAGKGVRLSIKDQLMLAFYSDKRLKTL